MTNGFGNKVVAEGFGDVFKRSPPTLTYADDTASQAGQLEKMISGYPMHEIHLRCERAIKPNLTYRFDYIDFDQLIIK